MLQSVIENYKLHSQKESPLRIFHTLVWYVAIANVNNLITLQSNSFTTRQGPKNIKSIQASASVFNFSDFTNALPSTAEKLPVHLPFSLSMQRQRKISLSSSLPNMKCLFQSNPSSARLCSSPTIMEPPADDVYLSLHRFVDKYSSNLPATFDVTKQNHSHIRKGKYTVYFITDTEVASVKDDADNVYILQMDDQSQFGIVYSGNEASVFETALDIINHANPPKLICALQPFKGRDAKSSVETNEVLLTTSKTKRHLKVYSITAKMKKNLSASCAGYFTTAPCATKLTIHEIHQYLSEILPATMEVFPANEIHILAGKKVVTFAHFHAKNTLVASYSTHSHGMQFTSIPLTEPIEVSVTGHSAAEYLCTPRLYDYPFMQHPFNSSSSQSVCDLPLPPPPRMNYSSSTEDSEDDKYVSIESLPPDALSALRNREFLRHLSHIQVNKGELSEADCCTFSNVINVHARTPFNCLYKYYIEYLPILTKNIDVYNYYVEDVSFVVHKKVC